MAFSYKIPLASYDGQLLLYPIVRVTWPDGRPIFPGLSEKPKKTKSTEIPKQLEDALPDLEKLLGGR